MAIPDGKTRLQITLDDEILEILDFVASEAGITRSKLIENFVEVAIDQLSMAAAVGMAPRRMKRLVEIIDSHPLIAKFGEMDIQKTRSRAKSRFGMQKKKEDKE